MCVDDQGGEGEVFGVDDLATGIDDRVSFGKGGRKRLLNEHYRPCSKGLQGIGSMTVWWRAHHNGVGARW